MTKCTLSYYELQPYKYRSLGLYIAIFVRLPYFHRISLVFSTIR